MILLKNRDRNPSFKKGEYVEINDAGNYPMELSVDGVCEQETTTGKNLLPNNATSQTINEINYTVNSDGSVYAKGTATARSEFTICDKPFTLNANTEYKFQTDILMILQTSTGYISGGKGKTFTSESEISVLKVYIRVENGTTIDKTIYPMITLSNQNDTYEQYTGGQPSPSPDYPQEIKTLTGDIKVTSAGKNLFDKNNLKSGSYLRTTGQWVAYGSRYCTKEMIKVKPNTNYIINNNNKSSYNIKNIVDCYDINKKYIGRISGMNGDDNEKSYIVPQNGMYFNITFNETSNTITKTIYEEYLENGIISPQLEQSNQATPYEPYQSTSLNITIPSNEFVGKLDDTYKDTLKVEYNEDDGHYHLILNKMVGKVVLNGSENWTLSSSGFILGTGEVYKHFKDRNINILDGFCNYFVVEKSSTTWTKINCCGWNTEGVFWIRDDHKLASTTDDFKSWLSTHNIEVYYALATPYEVDLGIVDTLLSYDKITNIFSDSDLYPVINAKYYKDFEFDKILRSGYNIDEQEYEIAKKQMANGKRKRILSSYDDCIIKINLGLLDNKTYQEYKEQLDDGEFHYWSYKYNQYKKANFILTKPSITTEYAYDDDIGIDDIEITLEKSSDVS